MAAVANSNYEDGESVVVNFVDYTIGADTDPPGWACCKFLTAVRSGGSPPGFAGPQ